jgi:hypothetical protein
MKPYTRPTILSLHTSMVEAFMNMTTADFKLKPVVSKKGKWFKARPLSSLLQERHWCPGTRATPILLKDYRLLIEDIIRKA